MAWQSPERLAELLCRTRGVPVVEELQAPADEIMDEGHSETVATSWQVQLAATVPDGRAVMAQNQHPSPMADTAVCRQLSEVGAGWANVHVRICAGGAGKPAFLPRPITQKTPIIRIQTKIGKMPA